MACSPDAPDASGCKGAAAANDAADAPTTAASAGVDVPSAKPQPPQTVDPASPGKVTFSERTAPMTADTATGLLSPLTALKQTELQRSNSLSSPFKKYLPLLGKHGAPVHLHNHSQATTPQVDSYAISKIDQAREKVKRSFDRSKLLEKDEFVFPRFELDELTLGKILGRGGFGTVLEIMAMETVDDPDAEEMKNKERGLSLSGALEGKSSVFRVDDVHGGNNRRRGGRRRKSHSFRLRRPHHHGLHGIHPGGHHFSLRFSHSHDSCEGLSPPAGGLRSISERESFERGASLEASKSHDGVTGDDDGVKKQRRLRAKSLSWKSARSAAHDVSHFFHWSPKHQHTEVEASEGKEATDPQAETNGEMPKDEIQDQSERVEARSGLSRGPRPTRRVSRNFSFRSWRDSEAGNEGADALSPEELEKYNIDMSFFSTSRNNSYHSNFDTAHDTIDELPGELTASGLQSELEIETKEVEGSGRRIVLFSTPKEGVSLRADAHLDDHSGHQDKTYITHHATNREGDARYVIKIISPDIVENDFKRFLQAAMDMATETYFLSNLNHPHILKLRAVGQEDMFSSSYFLVLDRLYDTLSDRIQRSWKQELDHLENSILVWNRSYKLRHMWEERMRAMKDLAGALAHLHELNIIYRDIKGENIGFDAQGKVKLFDFGLSKEVHEEDECANGTYKLTPNTGSIRYMAPENGNKWPYNFMADSYSFGILLWEVVALETPFASYTPREIRDMVMKWGERPKIREGWSERVVELMTSAWDSNFRKRPSMRAIEETLEKEINDSL
ncbi:hypothetical protein ACHAXT_002929 [Thalassiosira profunda]